MIPVREIVEIQATIGFQAQKMRVAAYARVSSASEEQLNSFENQITHYTKFITNHEDWEFVEVYSDEGISGVSMNKREQFLRMLQDCREGKIDRIITKSTSRFARNTTDSVTTLRELKELGVSVYFEKEGIDTAKMSGENLVTLYSLFAQEESQAISTNCKKGIRMRMQNGTFVSSTALYGYRIHEKKLEIVEKEAEVVERIFKDYLNGKGTAEIARNLNAENVTWEKNESGWNQSIIVFLLKNERYKGCSLLQKNYAEDILPYKKKKNKGQLPQYFVENSHPAIVSEIQFELANILMAERGAKVITTSNDSFLSSKIQCECCGISFRYRKTNDKQYWVCRNHDFDATACDSKRIREDSIHLAFVTLYNKLKANYKEIFIPLAKQLSKLEELKQRENSELKEINLKISEVLEERMTITSLMTSGILDEVLFLSQKDMVEKKLEKLKTTKKRLLEKSRTDTTLEKTEEMIQFLEASPTTIQNFEEIFFEELVEKIIAFDQEKASFLPSLVVIYLRTIINQVNLLTNYCFCGRIETNPNKKENLKCVVKV